MAGSDRFACKQQCDDCARRITAWSLAANVIGVVLKLVVGLLVGSHAIVADAMHSMTDTLSYGINFTGSRMADRDGDSPAIGPGLLVGSITLLSGVWLGATNALILLQGSHARPGLLGLVVSGASILVNGRLYYLARCATTRSTHHGAYVAMIQLRTDFLASSLAFVSVLVAASGFVLADPLCALLIGLLMIGSAVVILRSTADRGGPARPALGRLALVLGALSVAVVSWEVQASVLRNDVILVPAQGWTVGSPVDGVLGRAPYFVVVDTRASTAVPVVNSARLLPGDVNGQLLALARLQKVDIVLAAQAGTQLYSDLDAAGIHLYYLPQQTTVAKAVGDFLAGRLERATGPNAEPGTGGGPRARWLRPW
jgi:predicted Fe-Mo cluster-binding NifX family protein